ncbi:MAG: sulfatase-like hydrolase/transferase, partial [Bacteroidota bacterium]
ETKRAYTAMVTDMDRNVAAILKQLDQLGLRDNTIVVFTSDNGATPDGTNLPFRGFKHSVYEGGTHLPTVIHWPGGKVVGGKHTVEPTAFFIHSRIHRARPKAVCVLHSHMPFATSITLLDSGRLDPVSQNALRFFGRSGEGWGYSIRVKNIWVARRIGYGMGFSSEGIALVVRPVKRYAPKFSRFAVIYTCSDFTFSAEKARKDFGFEPKYTLEQAYDLTVGYYSKKNPARS